MHIKINSFIHKSFFLCVFFSTIVVLFTRSGLLSFLPILIFSGLACIFSISKNFKLNHSEFVTLLSALFFSIYCLTIYFINPYDSRYITAQSLFFIYTLVTVWLTIRISRIENTSFKIKLLKLFLTIQIFAIIGQYLHYSYGLSFPVREKYEYTYMLSGTFSNSNDTAAVTLIFLLIYDSIENSISDKEKYLILFSFTFIFLATASRTALLIYVLFLVLRKGINYRFLLYAFIATISYKIIYMLLESFSYLDPIYRLFIRLDTLSKLVAGNLSSDHSASLRVHSYKHFINNFTNLYMGTGKLGDYKHFANGFNDNAGLVFVNPHSLIVEMGYWAGWPGLFFLILFIIVISSQLPRYKMILFIAVFIGASFIPSSVFGIFLFIMIYIISCNLYKKRIVNW